MNLTHKNHSHCEVEQMHRNKFWRSSKEKNVTQTSLTSLKNLMDKTKKNWNDDRQQRSCGMWMLGITVTIQLRFSKIAVLKT